MPHRPTTPAERAAIYAMRVEGLSFREIAERTGRTQGSLSKILKAEGYSSLRKAERATIPLTRYEDDPAAK